MIELLNADSYEIEIWNDDILIIHDFLSEEECSALYKQAVAASEADWTTAYIANKARHLAKYNKPSPTGDVWADKILRIDDRDMAADLTERLQTLFNIDVHKVKPFSAIQRHYPGTKLNEHRDTVAVPSLAYAVVAYLNDNYEGGTLYFRELGLERKMSRRSLALFTASLLHGVHEVTGTLARYTLISFVDTVVS
jgi:2OG-Fe(II) oxygenase superfamily